MPEIFINCSVPTEVSEEDFDLLSGLCFSLDKNGYLRCKSSGEFRDKYIQQIVGERMGLPKSDMVDHKDMNPLNNKRDNLRSATFEQNQMNQGVQVNNKLGLKGVHFDERSGKFIAQIQVNKKHTRLGEFDDPFEAHEAYCQAAKRYFGEFANSG